MVAARFSSTSRKPHFVKCQPIYLDDAAADLYDSPRGFNLKPAEIMTMRRAFAYIRFSSAEQRKGDSLRRQLREARQWCERNNAILDEGLDYLRELGRTGFDGSNLSEGGGLGLFLRAVKEGKVSPGSVLLVEKLDRFSRTDIDVAIAFFGKVLRSGIAIVSMRSGVEYTVDMLKRQPTAIMTAVMEFILANEESVKKSDRLLSAWAGKREAARQRLPMTKRGPLWLRLSEDRLTWEVVEDRAQVVRLIFEKTAGGMGAYRLAAYLNQHEIRPLENREQWTQKSIHRILCNRAVLGEFQPQRKLGGKPVDDGPPVKDYFPRIISDEVFYKAWQQINAKRVGGRKAGGRAGQLFLFQKLAYDVDTGSSLVIKATKGGLNRGYIRYVMPSAGLRGGKRTSFPCEIFEKSILKGLSEIRVEDIIPSQENEVETQIAQISGKLAELNYRITETTQAMAEQPPALMGAIVRQVAAWEEEKAGLARELEELRAVSIMNKNSGPFGEMKTVIGLLDQSSGDEREQLRMKLRSVIRSLVKKISVKIRPGKHRLEKSCVALVEFNHCPETRVFMFGTPFKTLLTLSGWTAADLLKG